MAWWIYYLTVYLMVGGVRLSALWNPKSRQWLSGRRHWRSQIRLISPKTSPRIWFHVSSLGEFEQARPVIEKLKQHHSTIEVVLTFFSPSGYNIRSGYDKALVLYLPADLPGNAFTWLELIQPDLAVFVKYDIWPGYLNALQQLKTPTLLISAHWIPGHGMRSWSVPPSNGLLKKLNRIFFQKEEYIAFFREKGFTNLQFAGDTRIDRSLELPAEASSRIPSVLAHSGPFDLVAGSTWKRDEDHLIPVIIRMKLKAIVAPHDVSEENIHRIMLSLPIPAFRLSDMTKAVTGPCVIVVDQMGILAYLYALGRIAYVGGGFGSGIHNTLEPMAHGKPVVFGPRHTRFPEAVDMVKSGNAFTISSTQQLEEAFRRLMVPGKAETAGAGAYAYLARHAGASDTVVKYIEELIPFGPGNANPSGH